jgi:hypothetical protein
LKTIFDCAYAGKAGDRVVVRPAAPSPALNFMKSRRFIRILLPGVLPFYLAPIGDPLRGFFSDGIP